VAGKQDQAKSPGKPWPSLIGMIAELVAAGDASMAPELFGMIAETLRARLDPDDAIVVATWFDRMAAGEAPAAVLLPRSGGRPKGATKARKPMPDGRIPDDLDIAWIVHTNLCRNKAGVVYKGVAKAFGMTAGRVRNIYSEHRAELEKLHEN
jgi:hypothetical protein